MGVVSPLGHEHGEFYDNLLAGKSGISMIEGFDASSYTTRFAGEIKRLDANGLIAKKMENRVDKLIKCVVVGRGGWAGACAHASRRHAQKAHDDQRGI
eukprot:363696-Chlamydomonas_euryale.AAC.19